MPKFKLVAAQPDSLNHQWSVFNKQFVHTLPLNAIFDQRSRIFTLGSCFAVEIRKALKKSQIAVFPQYETLSLEPDRYRIGDFPVRENFNYYNTFSIEQEFAKALQLWSQDEQDYWQVPDRWWGTEDLVYQDPYRRCVFGRTREDVIAATRALDDVVRQGAQAADGFLITLGLIEVWKKKDNQKVACMQPGYNAGGGAEELQFHLSSFSENLDNLRNIISHICDLNAKAQIVFTVSPVPLGKTFTDNDVFVANMESKSLLRAAAAQVCREHEQVHYFPSYDICSAIKNVYTEDGRHIRPEIVKMILNGFFASYFSA
ncbi:MAG: GSCFA domain-containing protein [Pseudomonadota bacterium]|nr:GSCFA domain-containing protein [Pseudomonadota bacterium]